MRYLLTIILLCLVSFAGAQNNPPSKEQVRQQMAKIRQTTNWDDPVAAKKANEEIKKLAAQLNTVQVSPTTNSNQLKQTGSTKSTGVVSAESIATKENVLSIAKRFYERNYKALDAVSKNKFDLDLKAATDDDFSLEAVRKLTSFGAALLTFGNDHLIACVYITSAVKAFPGDTLSVNNFGAYLRMIDSLPASISVLLYANSLFSESPVILTQLGNSYFELDNYPKAESYYKAALKINPEFGQAHSSLCDLYIKQNRLQDAILELFAGVKGMGCSYKQASNNFAYLQEQAENSPNGETEKEKFWDETRNQMNPPDPLAPLVPVVDRLKMPAFGNCLKVADWTEGGGYSSAVQAYTGFHGQLMKFNGDFLQVHQEVPALPPNAILRDFPNERFALDCILEYFFRESKNESHDFNQKVDEIMKQVNMDADAYFQKAEQITKAFVSCFEGCGGDDYCLQECKRVYCTQECPSANTYNSKLQSNWEQYLKEFQDTKEKQKKNLDDLYEFTEQWFSKIESPYWSKIYAYEIQRVALTIIGNSYAAYQQAFPWLAHNSCGTDCSVYANPYPIPPEEVSDKKPKSAECPDITKIKFGLGACDIGLDCESIEFGCSEGLAFSLKRNFVKKTTTGFFGVGMKACGGFTTAGFKAGMEITVSDNNEVTDAGFKADASITAGSGVTRASANTTGSFTIMTGFKGKVGTSFGGKGE